MKCSKSNKQVNIAGLDNQLDVGDKGTERVKNELQFQILNSQ